MKNTNLVKNNKRLKEELDEVIGRDELYTPRSHDKQSAEGNRKEDSMQNGLTEKMLSILPKMTLEQVPLKVRL